MMGCCVVSDAFCLKIHYQGVFSYNSEKLIGNIINVRKTTLLVSVC
jgi:hypothetical protein